VANPFTRRRPWAAALIGLVFGPFVAMLYLNRGRLALVYLAVEWLYAAVAIAAAPVLLTGGVTSPLLDLIYLPLHLVGAVHGYWIARQWDPSAPRHWFSRWYAIVGLWLIAPILAISIRAFLVQPFSIASGAMQPTLSVGDYVFASKRAYDARAPERGDVIVFHPRGMRGDYIKRIVGLPGERVQLVNGNLVIDGRAVARRPAGTARVPDCAELSCRFPLFRETYPGGRSALVLDRGDTRSDHTAVFVVPPGSYFVLGDDRDESLDSRDDRIGFVSRDAIAGRVTLKFASGGHWTWQTVE
jgi:signal peptidase I